MSETLSPISNPASAEAPLAEQYPPITLELVAISDTAEVVSRTTESLFLVGEAPRTTYEGGKKFPNAALTDNPELLLAMLADGPSALDREHFTDTPQSMVVLTDGGGGVGVSPKYDTIAYAYRFELNDGNMTLHFDRDRFDVAPTSEDPTSHAIPSSIKYDNNNSLETIRENGNLYAGYIYNYGYREIPQVRAFYETIGLGEPERDGSQVTSLTAPTPATLLARVEEARNSAENTLFIPEIELVHDGAISPTEYISIFAEGKFPIAVGDFYYYFHDLTSEHFGALLEHGEPLMDLMTQFASAVRDSESLTFSEYRDGDLFGELSGTEKDSRVAGLLDDMTSMMQDIGVQQPKSERSYHTLMKPMFTDILNALQVTGKLEQTSVVQSLLEKGTVSDISEITYDDLIEGIIELTREQFGIEELPTRQPEVSDDDILF